MCLYAPMSFFFIYIYISAFPCSLIACGQTAVLPQFDSQMSDCTVPLSPPFSPCCDAVHIRLLSQVGPKVFSLLQFQVFCFMPGFDDTPANDIQHNSHNREWPSFPHKSALVSSCLVWPTQVERKCSLCVQ